MVSVSGIEFWNQSLEVSQSLECTILYLFTAAVALLTTMMNVNERQQQRTAE